MEVKKSPKAELESKKSTWLLIGYVIGLAFLFVSFEWSERDAKVASVLEAAPDVVFEEEMIPITETPPQQAAPPPPKAMNVAELLEVVDDNMEVEEEVVATLEDMALPSQSTGVNVAFVPTQVVEEEPKEDEIFDVVEKMPEFPGGEGALMKYLKDNIHYPTIAQENGTQGKVILQFVVNVDGSIVDINVVRSVDPYIDKEAVRVVQKMPKWKPGMQRQKPVRVKYTLPVQFKLN